MPNKYEGHSFDELKGVAADTTLDKKEYTAARREAKKRSEAPTNHEIQDLMEKSTHSERLEMSKAMVEGALKAADLWEKPLDPAKATQLDEEGLQKLCNRPSGEKDSEVFFKRVSRKKKKGPLWNRREVEEPTGEILVVIRLNNGNDKRLDEATIVTAVVQHKQGVLQVEKGPGLYGTRSERAFRDELNPPQPEDGSDPERSNLNKLYSGELTHADYLKRYKKENKQSLHEYWRDHDKVTVDKPEYWGTAEAKQEMLNRIKGKYEEAVEGFTSQLERLQEEDRLKIEEKQRKMEELNNDYGFILMVWTGYTAELRKRPQNQDKTKIQAYEAAIAKRGLSVEDIPDLIKHMGKNKKKI